LFLELRILKELWAQFVELRIPKDLVAFLLHFGANERIEPRGENPDFVSCAQAGPWARLRKTEKVTQIYPGSKLSHVYKKSREIWQGEQRMKKAAGSRFEPS
jgi:hypothetical protein